MNLQDFKDNLAKSLYGITKEQAHAANVCIDCKEPQTGYPTDMDLREYQISGLCSKCFDKSVGATEEDTAEMCTLKFQPSATKTTSNFSAKDFDTKYDFDCIKSERAFEEARIMGEVVVLPKDNELQVDIDRAEDYGVYLENLERVDSHIAHILYATERPSRHKAEGKHITLTLDDTIEPEKRIMLQLFLGSDRVRELLSYVRLINDDPHPTLFIEKKPQALLTEGDNGNS